MPSNRWLQPGVGGLTPEEVPIAQAQEEEARRQAMDAEDEGRFWSWYRFWANKAGLDPNPDHPLHKYDYRAAFRAGVEPTMDENGEWHWPSEYKFWDHPNRYVEGRDTKMESMAMLPDSLYDLAAKAGATLGRGGIVTNTDTLQSDLNIRIAGFLRKTLGAKFTEKDRDFLEKALGNLEKDPVALKQILDMYQSEVANHLVGIEDTISKSENALMHDDVFAFTPRRLERR